VAVDGATTAYRIDLIDRSVRPLDVPAGVTQLDRLRGSDVLLFSANSGEAAWLLRTDGPNLRAGFAQPIDVSPLGRRPVQTKPITGPRLPSNRGR
jgi:hypothetical protein